MSGTHIWFVHPDRKKKSRLLQAAPRTPQRRWYPHRLYPRSGRWAEWDQNRRTTVQHLSILAPWRVTQLEPDRLDPPSPVAKVWIWWQNTAKRQLLSQISLVLSKDIGKLDLNDLHITVLRLLQMATAALRLPQRWSCPHWGQRPPKQPGGSAMAATAEMWSDHCCNRQHVWNLLHHHNTLHFWGQHVQVISKRTLAEVDKLLENKRFGRSLNPYFKRIAKVCLLLQHIRKKPRPRAYLYASRGITNCHPNTEFGRDSITTIHASPASRCVLDWVYHLFVAQLQHALETMEPLIRSKVSLHLFTERTDVFGFVEICWNTWVSYHTSLSRRLAICTLHDCPVAYN